MTALKAAAGAGAIIPALVAAASVAAGLLSPGYDPLDDTVSQLADPGRSYAIGIDLALAFLGASFAATACVVRVRLATGLWPVRPCCHWRWHRWPWASRPTPTPRGDGWLLARCWREEPAAACW